MDVWTYLREYGLYFAVAVVLFLLIKGKRPQLDITQTDKWRRLTTKERGDRFEAWCAELLRQHGYHRIKVIGGSGDQGKDIICWKNGIRHVIQCKCYRGNVGNDAVQQVYAAIKYVGNPFVELDKPIVMTNSYFTASAKEAARRCKVELWDRDTLDQMCRGYNVSPVVTRKPKKTRKPARARMTRKPTKRPVRRKQVRRW